MERDGFVFYKSFITGIDTIPDAAEQLKAYKYIIRYGIFGECPEEENSISYGFFSMAKPQIDANNKRFANGKKGGQFGHLGGAPKGNQNAVKSWNNSQNNPNGVEQNNPKTTPKEKEKEKEKEIKEKNKKEKCDDSELLDTNVSRSTITDLQQDADVCLNKKEECDIGFENVYRNFYHKNGTKRDEKKSKKKFDGYKFNQQELKDILYDEKIFKFEYKYKIKDPQYWPGFDTYISGFNRYGDKQWEDRLYAIALYHMSHKDDITKMQERSKELKAAFGDSLIKDITHRAGKELSQLKLIVK